MTSGRSFLRDNIFLVAAVSLPLIVVAFFLASSAIPRWRVPPPAYDLVFRANAYFQRNPRVTAEFKVRNGKVEAIARGLPAGTYWQTPALFLFDHTTMTAREIPIDLPDSLVE